MVLITGGSISLWDIIVIIVVLIVLIVLLKFLFALAYLYSPKAIGLTYYNSISNGQQGEIILSVPGLQQQQLYFSNPIIK